MMKTRQLAIACAIATLATLSHAALNIPNPLMEPAPPKADRPSKKDDLPDPNIVNASMNGNTVPVPTQSFPPMGPGAYGGVGYGAQNFGDEGKRPGNKPADEARAYLSHFFVTAITGGDAVLRRTPTPSGALVTTQSSINASPIPAFNSQTASQQTVQAQPTGRSESLMVSDGEALEYYGEGVSLLPRVQANRVVIYLVESGARKSGRRTVVFSGDVVSSGATRQPITLEKKDPDYKAAITVKKAQNGNGTGTTGSTATPAPLAPLVPPNF